MQTKNLFVLCVVFILVCAGCRQQNKAPDVSDIPVQVTISRFDQEFMAVDTTAVEAGLQKLNHQYPTFFPVYMNQIMNFGYAADSNTRHPDPVIKKFIESKDIRQLQNTINAHFTPAKIQEIQRELEASFRYMKYYLPEFKVPRVVTFMSALSNYGAITVDTVLGIGLDMFLGADFPLYKQVANPYPDYILRRFSPDNLITSCIKALVQKKYPPLDKGTLLDHMIAQGQVLYFLDKVLPDTPDSIKIHYTKAQLDWCNKNEQFIWQYFIRNDLLYKNESLTIRYYVGPGPTSRGMPDNAPGNIGSWIGWQIVRKYMEENPTTALAGLMKMTDGQKILTASGYHPH